MEHHATVDKGLKMKIKKKKSESKDSRLGNSHGHTSTFINQSKPHQPSTHYKPSSSEIPACDKSSMQERTQGKKDKVRHDKHANKVSSNSQIVQKVDPAAMKHSSNVKQEKSSKNESRQDRAVDMTSGQFTQIKHENKQANLSRRKDTQNEHHVSSYDNTKEGHRVGGPQIHDPYDFNSKEEDQVNQSSHGGLLLGLSTMKLKVEKGIDASPRARMDEETKETAVGTSSVGVVTDPECLGPCEPGTSVVLEGIVWNETENGILVVNVTWRGKTYVGTLMDATKHAWAPPRFSCESPVSDLEAKTPKSRGKRGRLTTTPVSDPPEGGRRLRQCRRNNTTSAPFNAPPSPAKTSSGKRKSVASEEVSSKKAKKSKKDRKSPVMSGEFIVCPEPDCNKKYRHINGLRYHQSHAHMKEANTDGDTASTAAEEFSAMDTTEPDDAKSRLASVQNDNDSNADDKMDKSCDREVANLNGLAASSETKPESESSTAKHLKKSASGSTGESSGTPTWSQQAESRAAEQTDSTSDTKDSDKKSISPPSLIKQGTSEGSTGGGKGERGSPAPGKAATTVEEEALSPAYSDISDANDSAPLLENQADGDCNPAKLKGKYDEGPDRAGEVPLGGFRSMYAPYYGQPPYLTPAVSSDALKMDKSNSSKDAHSDNEVVNLSQTGQGEKQVPPSLQSHSAAKPFGDYSHSRFITGFEHTRGKASSAQSSPVGASAKSSEHLPRDLSVKEPSSHAPDHKSAPVYSQLSNPDGNFQILKENMELKDQIRDKKDGSGKDFKKASHDNKSYLDERCGYDKVSNDYSRFYGSKSLGKPGGDKGKKEDRSDADSGAGSKSFLESGSKEGRPGNYADSQSGGRDEKRDGKSSGGEKGSGRSGQSPSVGSGLPFYPSGYPPYSSALPYESGHSLMMPGFPGAPFLHHPHSQLRYHDSGSPAHSPSSSAESKTLPSTHHPSFYTSAGRKPEPPTSRPSSDTKPPAVSTPEGKPPRDGENREGLGGKGEPGSRDEPPVQRHLHSHHHTHVVGPPFPLYPHGHPHGWM